MSKDFVHLHNHTDFSLFDGFMTPDEMAQRAKELDYRAIAMTDHGKVGGFIKHAAACKEAGIKPIFGLEAYVVDDLNVKKIPRRHLILLAKNNVGYTNLIKLCSKSHTHLAYNFPRVDFNMLKEYSEGLIVSTACIEGEFAQRILSEDIEGAHQFVKKYKEVWGDDFYLEVMYTKIPEQKLIIKHAMECSKKFDVKIIATNDCHYALKEDHKYQQVKKSISMRGPLRDPDKPEYFIKSYDEMNSIFKRAGEEFLKNTVEVAEKCNVEISMGEAKLPIFVIPKDNIEFNTFKEKEFGKNAEQQYLIYLARKGLKNKRLHEDPVYIARLEEELETIRFTGFDRYFLIVQEYTKWAMDRNVRVGLGRGCFLPGSSVITQKGLKDIEKIKNGEFVLSHDGSFNEVKKTYEYEDINEKIIVLNTDDGREIKCTSDHRILVNKGDNKVWVAAKDIKIDDEIVDLKERWSEAKVISTATEEYNGPVYDLCVNETHTYNIDGLAVHNSGVGSLVLYVLGVIGIDPLKHDLSMDRFLYCEAEYRTSINYYYSDPKEAQAKWESQGKGNKKRKRTADEINRSNIIVRNCVKKIKEKAKIGAITEEQKSRLKVEIDFIINRPTLVDDIFDILKYKKKNGAGDKNDNNLYLFEFLETTNKKADISCVFHFDFLRDEKQSRISPPDIDIDFEHREEILVHLCDIYGPDKVALIGTTNTYKPKAAIQFAAKALDITGTNEKDAKRFSTENDQEAKRISKIMSNLALSLKQWIGDDPHFKPPNNFIRECQKRLRAERVKYPELFEVAARLEGRIRAYGTHAAGVVISQSPITDDVPLHVSKVQKDNLADIGISLESDVSTSGLLSTQFDMEEVEKIGLLKFDFLQLENLRQISMTLDSIKERHGSVDFDIDNLEMNDDKVFSLIRSMKLEGLFQISGDAFVGRDFPLFDKETGEAKINKNTGKQRIFHSKGVMEIIGCDSFADIVAPLSLGRPGPLSLNMPRLYAEGKINKDHLEYPHPKLEPILKDTYAQMIFQEQLISMAMVLAGFNFSEADKLRKAVGKKKPELLIPIEPKFREGCEKRNIPNNVIDNMWEIAVEFGAYAFNRSLYFSEKVRTNEGEYSIEEIYKKKKSNKSLPKVYSPEGKEIQIINVYDHGVLPVYKVEFYDGSIVKCSMRHKFKTKNGVFPLYKILFMNYSVLKNFNGFLEESFIKNVEFFIEGQCYDLEVDSDDHLYLLSNGIVTSNSHCLSSDVLLFSKEDKKFMKVEDIKPGTILDSFVDGEVIEDEVIDLIDTGKQEVYEISLSNGQKIECTLNHKFMCSDEKYRTVQKIIKGDYEVFSKVLKIVKIDLWKENMQKCKITSIKKIGIKKTYNIEMASRQHNYAVFGKFGKNFIISKNSVAYGAICYQTAFLKTYFPTEFMCSLLTSAASTSDEKLNKVTGKLKHEYRHLKINRPDINKSKKIYSPVGDFEIISPLFSLKGVGKKVSDIVVEARERMGVTDQNFVSIDQFFMTVNSGHKTTVAAGMAETLLEAGVFSSLGNKPKIRKEIMRYQAIKKSISKKSSITDKRLLEKVENIF